MKKITPVGLSVKFYWYISQISGERLQDHWSSGRLVHMHSNTITSVFKVLHAPNVVLNSAVLHTRFH